MHADPSAGSESSPTVGPIRFRRSPPNPDEQARRVAWGKKWGSMVSQAVKQSKERL